MALPRGGSSGEADGANDVEDAVPVAGSVISTSHAPAHMPGAPSDDDCYRRLRIAACRPMSGAAGRQPSSSVTAISSVARGVSLSLPPLPKRIGGRRAAPARNDRAVSRRPPAPSAQDWRADARSYPDVRTRLTRGRSPTTFGAVSRPALPQSVALHTYPPPVLGLRLQRQGRRGRLRIGQAGSHVRTRLSLNVLWPGPSS